MALVLFEHTDAYLLYPFATVRPVADLRVGILSFKERWEILSGQPAFLQSRVYLQELNVPVPEGSHLWLDAALLPNVDLLSAISALQEGDALAYNDRLIAGKPTIPISKIEPSNFEKYFNHISAISGIQLVSYPADILRENTRMVQFDFDLLAGTRKRISIDHFPSSQFICPENIFIEDGASVEYSYINAIRGPVFIAKNAKVLAGSFIQGPFVLGEGSIVKMGSHVYGTTSVGPYCTIGGEIKNSVFLGFSNKAHDGYLGDSIIGHWCNMGAGTTVSNVKNTGSAIQLAGKDLGKKAGVWLGDYSRTAIHTSINSGTMIGICCNVFGTGLTPKIIPDFSWGFPEFQTYQPEKAIEHITNWKSFKNQPFTEKEKSILRFIFAHSKNIQS